jgi:hypothetical protein
MEKIASHGIKEIMKTPARIEDAARKARAEYHVRLTGQNGTEEIRVSMQVVFEAGSCLYVFL